MSFYVYLIATKINNKIISYAGYTKNLSKRLNLHNSSKGAKFTKGKKWVIIYSKKYKTKKNAMKNEYKLKKNIKFKKYLKKKYVNKFKV
tara:strand:+ start:616 stop:882 length:267 start_codon:yes stop_codon:yes gene_type:complete